MVNVPVPDPVDHAAPRGQPPPDPVGEQMEATDAADLTATAHYFTLAS